MLRLADIRHQFPKRLAQCADYIEENIENITIATVAETAAGAGVSPSAMMRFAQAMGFEGYSDMQRLFRASIKRELPDYSTRLKHLQEAGAGSPSAMLAEFVEAGRRSLETLTNTVDPRTLDVSVEQLATADCIHIMGLRRAFPVATYMSYAFEKMKIPAILHQNTGGLGFANSLRPDDAAIAITFAPYSPETLDFIARASEDGLPTAVVTDKRAALPSGGNIMPILVSEVDFGAFRSLSATLTIAISLAVSIGTRREALR
ncbi:MAG: MurR/RpiR family transcriptional regulator [Pseudomonadota bacterium]